MALHLVESQEDEAEEESEVEGGSSCSYRFTSIIYTGSTVWLQRVMLDNEPGYIKDYWRMAIVPCVHN